MSGFRDSLAAPVKPPSAASFTSFRPSTLSPALPAQLLAFVVPTVVSIPSSCRGNVLCNLMTPSINNRLCDCCGNPLNSSYEICPASRASFCTGHSSSTVGPASALTSSSVRRRPCKTDVANEIGNIPGCVELDSSSSTIGWQSVMNVPTLLRFRHPRSRYRMQGVERLGALTPAVMKNFMQETVDLARFVSDRFTSTTSGGSIWLQSWRTSGLVDSWIASP